MKKEWFAEWFDSPYYHLLYKNRDLAEAEKFITSLLGAMDLKSDARLLDLACGKGRHSRFLASKGFDVVGVDIAQNSIDAAKAHEQSNLHFFQHDMRNAFKWGDFDAVFSFFTSFGYFKTDKEHLQTLQNIHQSLKPNGHFLMDFFNAYLVQKNLVHQEVKTVGGIEFRIKRYVRHGCVFKKIEFTTHDGKCLWFKERVRLFSETELKRLFESAGLKVYKTLGDYDLSEFDTERSPRLILLAKKL